MVCGKRLTAAIRRCGWAENAAKLDRDYHDQEWGRTVRGDQQVFERLSLEAFQAGLSWSVILRKRPAFREVFANFAPQIVANMSESDVSVLLSDARIVRNKAKIDATICNARAVLDLPGSLSDLVWSFMPPDERIPTSDHDIPSTTRESVALAKALKAHGFKFVGPTTAYAMMQAIGVVNDHLVDCVAREIAYRAE